jgi:hypothetical protein
MLRERTGEGIPLRPEMSLSSANKSLTYAPVFPARSAQGIHRESLQQCIKLDVKRPIAVVLKRTPCEFLCGQGTAADCSFRACPGSRTSVNHALSASVRYGNSIGVAEFHSRPQVL